MKGFSIPDFQFTEQLLLIQALPDNISAGIVNKHLILKVTAPTAIPENKCSTQLLQLSKK